VADEQARRLAAARARHERGVAETAAGRPVAGARHLSAALALLRTPAGEADAGTAEATGRVLLSLAHAEAEAGRTRRGLARLDEAERLLPHARGVVLNQRGLMLLRLGREREALRLLDAAVPALTGPGDRLVLARTLLNRGNLHAYAGRVAAARADLTRCREIADADGHRLLAAKAVHNLGTCELVTGDIPAALRAYDVAAGRYRTEGQGFLAVIAVDRARALLAAGLAREAGRELAEALQISREVGLEEDYAEAELGRALAAGVAGDAATARVWARRANRRFARRGNRAWAELATLAALRAEVQEALPVGGPGPGAPAAGQIASSAAAVAGAAADEAAVAVVGRVAGPAADEAAVAVAGGVAGAAAGGVAGAAAGGVAGAAAGGVAGAAAGGVAGAAAGEAAVAVVGRAAGRRGAGAMDPAVRQRLAALARRCQASAARLRGLRLAHDADRADLLAARLLAALGRDAEAERLVAGAARRGAPLENQVLRALVAAELAQAGGDRRRLFRQARSGLDVLHRHRVRYGSADLQAGASALGYRLADVAVVEALRSGSPRLVFDWSERARGQVLRSRPVLPPGDPELAAALGELRQLRHAGRLLELSGRRDPVLRGRVAELERLIRERGWRASGTGESSATATLPEVAAALGDRVMVVLFFPPGRMVALVIRDGAAKQVELGAGSAVPEAVRRVVSGLDVLAGRLPDRLAAVVRGSARAQLGLIDEAVFAPLRAEIGDRELVFVSVTPAPWTLLPALRGRPVTVVPSASVWLAATRAAAAPLPPGQPVLIAGPYLAHAESEVDRISAAVPGSQVLAGASATVDGALKALDGAPLAHLAAHGHHQPENVLFSSLDLADGPLMAYDLQALRTPPRQVVLSACEVGRADVRAGEEVFGFTAALLHAGTPTVVASVSRVPDEAALDVMTAYHRALATGVGPAAALAGALPPAALLPFTCYGAG
jgi:tetratricopeptide (TPR) repeat protein